ncbi:alpha-N-acetylneuraminide alpha-2,8-sialyltransferase-like isoform X2 [Patiria miniata]|uniref:Alpha-2,8-sialyltransferase 8B-like n=1 Tax=Patiria miniata TaxID=46514 RepID=A0A914BHI1_PATMI|nr:alpha-N-acetylneuraminide alpha-2,8-sialyltransferase-like isoform X2 [Patiria miniata]
MRRYSRLRGVIALVLVAVCVLELLLVAFGGSGETNQDLHREESLVGALAGVKSKSRPSDEAHEHAQKTQPSAPTDNRTASEGGTQTSYSIDEVIANLSKPWVGNETRKVGIRRKLDSVMNATEYAVLTKQFTVLGQNLTFAIAPSVVRNLTNEVYQMLPEQSPFSTLKMKRCSVVGNGGILKHSYCGKAIDGSDFVFRCNAAPLKGYQQHTGRKSNMTSINPGGVIAAKYKRLPDIGHRNRFLTDMKAYGDLLIPVYGVNINAYTTSMLALRLLHQKGSTTRGLIINPDHFRGLQDMWSEMGLRSRMTTGFYLASVALSVCNSTDLYGFWPFAKGPNHRAVSYHYYDRLNISKGVHNFNWEFDVLYRLHMGGVLQMHAGPCT